MSPSHYSSSPLTYIITSLSTRSYMLYFITSFTSRSSSHLITLFPSDVHHMYNHEFSSVCLMYVFSGYCCTSSHYLMPFSCISLHHLLFLSCSCPVFPPPSSFPFPLLILPSASPHGLLLPQHSGRPPPRLSTSHSSCSQRETKTEPPPRYLLPRLLLPPCHHRCCFILGNVSSSSSLSFPLYIYIKRKRRDDK